MTQDGYSGVKTKPLNHKLHIILKYSGFIIIIILYTHINIMYT